MVYDAGGCSECGNGLTVEFFENKDQMHKHVQTLHEAYYDTTFHIESAGLLSMEYDYQPVEHITRYEPVVVEKNCSDILHK